MHTQETRDRAAVGSRRLIPPPRRVVDPNVDTRIRFVELTNTIKLKKSCCSRAISASPVASKASASLVPVCCFEVVVVAFFPGVDADAADAARSGLVRDIVVGGDSLVW